MDASTQIQARAGQRDRLAGSVGVIGRRDRLEGCRDRPGAGTFDIGLCSHLVEILSHSSLVEIGSRSFLIEILSRSSLVGSSDLAPHASPSPAGFFLLPVLLRNVQSPADAARAACAQHICAPTRAEPEPRISWRSNPSPASAGERTRAPHQLEIEPEPRISWRSNPSLASAGNPQRDPHDCPVLAVLAV